MLKKTPRRKGATREISAVAGNEKKTCAGLSVWRPSSLPRAVQVLCAQPLGLQEFGAELYPHISSRRHLLPEMGLGVI